MKLDTVAPMMAAARSMSILAGGLAGWRAGGQVDTGRFGAWDGRRHGRAPIGHDLYVNMTHKLHSTPLTRRLAPQVAEC